MKKLILLSALCSISAASAMDNKITRQNNNDYLVMVTAMSKLNLNINKGRYFSFRGITKSNKIRRFGINRNNNRIHLPKAPTTPTKSSQKFSNAVQSRILEKLYDNVRNNRTCVLETMKNIRFLGTSMQNINYRRKLGKLMLRCQRKINNASTDNRNVAKRLF